MPSAPLPELEPAPEPVSYTSTRVQAALLTFAVLAAVPLVEWLLGGIVGPLLETPLGRTMLAAAILLGLGGIAFMVRIDRRARRRSLPLDEYERQLAFGLKAVMIAAGLAIAAAPLVQIMER